MEDQIFFDCIYDQYISWLKTKQNTYNEADKLENHRILPGHASLCSEV
jgi:hypothetical protein